MGVLFVRMPKCWQAFEDIRFISLMVALTSYGVILIKFYTDIIPSVSWDLMEMIIKWSWISTLIGFSRHYLNRTNEFLRYANSIVYPFFILHQTVIIVIGYYVIDWGMVGALELITIIVGTFIVCITLTELVIKRSNILRILFGLKTKNKEPELILNSSS